MPHRRRRSRATGIVLSAGLAVAVLAGCAVELRVERVIDAKTVDLEGVGTTRLVGVNPPEEGRCGSEAATRFTRRMLQGRRVKYEVAEGRKDRWRRTLAYLTHGDTMHNLALIEQGYAKALPIRHKYANRFKAAEQNAKQQDQGPLAECAKKQEADAKKREADALARARAKQRDKRAEQAARLARRLREVERRAKEDEPQDRGDGDDSGRDRSAGSGSSDSGRPKKRRRIRRSDRERIRRSVERLRIPRRVVGE